MGVNQGKIVTKEQFDSKRAEVLKETPDRVLLLETPASDAKLMEELLGIEKGTLPEFACGFVKGAESCSKCGRHYSILDLTKTGLQVHSKQFLIDTIFGKHGGYLWNDSTQIHNCYSCGEKAPEPAIYITQFYGCA